MDLVFSNIKRTSNYSVVIVALFALGIGFSMPVITIYTNLVTAPLVNGNGDLYKVMIDSWAEYEPYNDKKPEEAVPLLSYFDVRNLSESTIQKDQFFTYQANSTVEASNKNLPAFRSLVRVTTTDFFKLFDAPFLEGTSWTKSQDVSGDSVVVISSRIKHLLFGNQSAIGETIELNQKKYNVVGVLDQWSIRPKFFDMDNIFQGMEDIYIPFETALHNKIVPVEYRSINQLADVTEENFDDIFRSADTVFIDCWVLLPKESVATYTDYLTMYVESQKAVGRFPRPTNNRLYGIDEFIKKGMEDSKAAKGTQILLIVGLLFFLVCLLNAVGLILAKIIVNTRQFAILLCIGASKNLIFLINIIEILVLAFAGSLIGLFLTYIESFYLGSFFASNNKLDLHESISFELFTQLNWKISMMGVFLAIVGSFIAVIYPAWLASRINPAEGSKV